MADLGFRQFRSLIKELDKRTLFDAVKPELQSLAEIAYDTKKRSDAYQIIFDLAYLACGGKGKPPIISDPALLVQRMGAGRDGKGSYHTQRVNAERIYFYFLFGDDLNDLGYAWNVDQKLFGESFFDKFSRQLCIWGVPRPEHLPPLEQAHLGPISVSLGYDTNLLPLKLKTVDAPQTILDGEPNVYAALHWSANLSRLVGRSKEKCRIVDWALAKEDKHVKVMLISGRGGTGKSRLAFEAVSELTSKNQWEGGFLRDPLPSNSTHFQGGSTGTAVIIDYPEERIEETKAILKAARQADIHRSPVRIILVSREDKERWAEHLNSHDLSWMDEVNLGKQPFVSIDEGATLISEVQEEFASRLNRELPEVKSARNWLERNKEHRLPLFFVAAAIHAVLEPQRAFSLNGKDILIALASREIERVRRFSKRDLESERVLEKLLGLSTMTPSGLTAKSIFQLGEMGICEGKNGDQLLEAVTRSPYWVNSSQSTLSHIVKLEPDLPAAALMAMALLGQPLQNLPRYMAISAMQAGDKFTSILSRLRFDVPIIGSSKGDELESCAIRMLEQCRELLDKLEPDGATQENVLLYGFFEKFTELKLNLTDSVANRAALLTNLAGYKHRSGKLEEAIILWRDSVEAYREVSKTEPEEFRPFLASTLSMLAIALFESKAESEAAGFSNEAAAIIANIPKFRSSVLPIILDALVNHAKILEKLGRKEGAVEVLFSASEMAVSLGKKNRVASLERLALIQFSIASILFHSQHRKEMFAAAELALRGYSELAMERPGTFAPRLAQTAKLLSEKYFEEKNFEESSNYASLTADIYKRFVSVRPESPLPDMANWYGTLANMMVQKGELDEALSIASASESLFSKLVQISDGALVHLVGLAKAADTVAGIYMKMEKLDLASKKNSDALLLFAQLPQPINDDTSIEYGITLFNNAQILWRQGSMDEALNSCKQSLKYLEGVSFGKHIHNGNFVGNLLGTLDLKGQIYLSLNRSDLAIECFKRELTIRRCTESFEELSVECIGVMVNLASSYTISNQHFVANAVFKEALEFISAIFYSEMDKYAILTGVVLRGYLESCGKIGLYPDQVLVSPLQKFISFE